MPEMQYNKLTTLYFILLYFSASHSLIGSQQGNQRHDVTTDFLVVNIKGILLRKKSACQIRQDRLSNPPDYFAFHFILVHLFYGGTKRLCPDPIVSLEQDYLQCSFENSVMN